jgi:hypothetical protein
MNSGRRPRILFVRPDHVGYVLLTLPAVGALRRALPGAYLAYAAAPAAAGIAARCPNLDETLTVRSPPFGREECDGVAWRETLRVKAARLVNASDAALVVRPADLGRDSSLPLRRYRSASGSTCRTRAHTSPRRCRYRATGMSPRRLRSGRWLLGRISFGGRTERVLAASLVPSRADEEQAREVLFEVDAADPLVVVQPGSGWPLKLGGATLVSRDRRACSHVWHPAPRGRDGGGAFARPRGRRRNTGDQRRRSTVPRRARRDPPTRAARRDDGQRCAAYGPPSWVRGRRSFRPGGPVLLRAARQARAAYASCAPGFGAARAERSSIRRVVPHSSPTASRTSSSCRCGCTQRNPGTPATSRP